MAKVRNDVACNVEKGCSLLSIVKCVVKDEDYTKWDVVKAIFYCCWYGGKRSSAKVLKWFCSLVRAVSAVFAILVLWVLSAVLLGSLAILSLLWYPLMMWFAPKSAAKLITVELEQKKNGLFRGIWDLGFNTIWNIVFCGILKSVWGWTWKYKPMAKKQYYLDATGVELKTLSTAEQMDYYFCNPSSETVKRMSFEAVDELRVQYKSLGDLKNICDIYEIYLELGKELFSGDEAMFELLKGYCANEKKRLSAKFTGFLIETLFKGEGGETWSRASSLVLLCCENHTLANHQLIMLAAGMGYDIPKGNEAQVVLVRYFSRHSFPDDVIRQIIMFATDQMADECKEKNFELLCKIARRDGLSTELAELFFAHCDSVQDEKMTDIFKIRMDCEKVGCSYKSDENRALWEQYCQLCKDISPEAQVQMKEWQYDVYRSCGHKLDKSVIYELLVKRLSREEMAYFEKVLAEEEERNTLSENGLKLMMLTPWKREIILSSLAKEMGTL